MRTLCLNLHKSQSPRIAENFLTFSPRVHYRDPGFVFVDISETSHLFGGEQSLMQEALKLSDDFFPGSSAAISDSPFTAQVFSHHHSSHISEPSQELEELSPLPLSSLLHLEGLIAWQSVNAIEDMIDFFHSIGFNKIGELKQLGIESFRQRWGENGTSIWKRLHKIEKQAISPLLPLESVEDYIYLDFPVSLSPFLLHCLEKSFKSLFHRLQARGEFARKVLVHLMCEYSNQVHQIEISSAVPSRDIDLYLKLLENKMAEVNLENPIREIEIEALTCPERIEQLDFWTPRVKDQDKLKALVSLFNQAKLTTGFYRSKQEFLPEKSWEVVPEFEESEEAHDLVEIEGQALRIRPTYSKNLSQAPRPSRLLSKPQTLSDSEVASLNFLSQQPIERLEDSWWESSRGRDYYVAFSQKGQCLWIYYDQIEQQYYLHGYFD